MNCQQWKLFRYSPLVMNNGKYIYDMFDIVKQHLNARCLTAVYIPSLCLLIDASFSVCSISSSTVLGSTFLDATSLLPISSL